MHTWRQCFRNNFEAQYKMSKCATTTTNRLHSPSEVHDRWCRHSVPTKYIIPCWYSWKCGHADEALYIWHVIHPDAEMGNLSDTPWLLGDTNAALGPPQWWKYFTGCYMRMLYTNRQLGVGLYASKVAWRRASRMGCTASRQAYRLVQISHFIQQT
jgi:hypothetical protein